MEGKAIIFCAPSGAGKTTLVKHLLKQKLGLEFSVSATSRKARVGEKNGKDYYFISNEEFKKKIKEDAFIEWEEVYEGTIYGTFKAEIERIWKNGKHVIFDVDVEGGINLKKYFGEKALAIFVKPPSIEVLRQRLMGRGTEDPEMLEKRVSKAAQEIARGVHFECTLVNDDLEKAKLESEKLVHDFLSK
jgi:guanylate kinase